MVAAATFPGALEISKLAGARQIRGPAAFWRCRRGRGGEMRDGQALGSSRAEHAGYLPSRCHCLHGEPGSVGKALWREDLGRLVTHAGSMS